MPPPDGTERIRPRQRADLRSKATTKASDSTLASPLPEASARRRWAYGLIRRSPSPVVYGSREWLALPEGSPAKIASVVVAAECWAQDGDDLPDRLALDLEIAQQANKAAEDAEYVESYRAHRAEWRRRMPKGKTFLERRSAQLTAVNPRPGDREGRGSS